MLSANMSALLQLWSWRRVRLLLLSSGRRLDSQ
jgi:hypothetical protein